MSVLRVSILMWIVGLGSVYGLQEWRSVREACFELGFADDPAASLVAYFSTRGYELEAEGVLLQPALDATAVHLPPWTLVSKLEEGLVKQVPPERIRAALEVRLDALRRARTLTESAQRGTGGLMLAVGRALESGVDEGGLPSLIEFVETHPPGMVMNGIRTAELLHLSGFPTDVVFEIARDCIVRELTQEEMLQVVKDAQALKREGVDDAAIQK